MKNTSIFIRDCERIVYLEYKTIDVIASISRLARAKSKGEKMFKVIVKNGLILSHSESKWARKCPVQKTCEIK